MVAIARKLAVRMYWMLRSGADYAQLVRMQGSQDADERRCSIARLIGAPCSREKSRRLKKRIMVRKFVTE